MKKYIFILLLSRLLFSCSSNDNTTQPVSNPNLVKNGSFELNGKPSLDYWYGSGDTTSLVANPAPYAGYWSLGLYPGRIPNENYEETVITGLSGQSKYRLSCWMMTESTADKLWDGRMALLLKREGVTDTLKSATNNTSEWNYVAFDVQINLKASDTLIIHLSAGTTEVVFARILFDNVVFDRQ